MVGVFASFLTGKSHCIVFIAGSPGRSVSQDSDGYGLPIQPLERGKVGTEPLSQRLEILLQEFVQGGALSPNYWPEASTEFTNPMTERYAGSSADPMMKFFPANSGSLNYSEDRIQKRDFVTYKTKCGVVSDKFYSMRSMYNKKKLYGLLRDGNIAVAPDRVVAESVGLKAGTSVKTYTLLAKEMCLRMEENVRQGGNRKKWSGFFSNGLNGRAGGGGGSAGGGGSSCGDRRSRRSSHGGNGNKRAKASHSVFDFIGSDSE